MSDFTLNSGSLLNSEVIIRAAIDGEAEKIEAVLQSLPSAQKTDALHQCVLRDCRPTGYTFTPLSAAAYYGHMDVVKLLVEDYDVDINQTESTGNFVTALHAAVLGNHLNIVQYFVARGCDVNLTNDVGKTVLFLDCYRRNLDIAKFLLQNGASLHIADKDGMTCLMQACELSNINLAQWLLECGADINGRNNWNQTALHIAARKNSNAMARLLLQHGAVLMRDWRGFTPVFSAATHRSYSVMDCFAESERVSKEDKIQGLELLGALTIDVSTAFSYLHRAMKERYRDPNQVVPKVASPLSVLSHFRESVSLEELEGRESDHDHLRLECWATMRRLLGLNDRSAWLIYGNYMRLLNKEGSKFGVSLLLEYVESGNNPTTDLWLQCLETFFSTLKYALSGDAELPFKDFKCIIAFLFKGSKDNQTLAKAGGRFVHESLQCLLLCLDRDPDLQEGTPLRQLAVILVRLSFLLLQGGSILGHALHYICFELKEDRPYGALMELLLDNRADPNIKDEDGSTPLHLIAEFSRRENEFMDVWVIIALLLLEAGALPGVRNSQGRTALDLAASSPVGDVIREFLPSSLQSLAAVAVLKNSISFQSEVSATLAAFVEQHK